MRSGLALLVPLLLLAAGCVTPADPLSQAGLGVLDVALPDGTVRAATSAAGLSTLTLDAATDATVTFPDGVLVQDAEGRLVPAEGAIALPAGAALRFLPPYGASVVRVALEQGGVTTETDLALPEGERFVSGDLAVELMKVQRDQFPHKTPGHENYGKAIAYFAQEFEALGLDVEVNEYADVAKVPFGSQPGPASLSSVVGYKRGTATPERYLVFGGHFDSVEQTIEGAFDNTAGAISTLVVAHAMANLTTEHTLVFAAWGGEEDGILGSQAWLLRHPELIPFIDGYWNFDVAPLAWPAPANDPAPMIIAAGPDGAATGTLHGIHEDIVKRWMQIDAPFVYESVVGGQLNGGGVNAQSDHTPFMTRGVPVYFPFTSRVPDVFALIHKEKDTIENMTKYALLGLEALDTEFTPEQMLEGERVLARSFETNMVAAFYWAVLTDAGVYPVPRAPAAASGLLG